MSGSLYTVLAACALTLSCACSSAHADGGRIEFSGAIVEPTCSISEAHVNVTAQPNPNATSQRFACGSADTAADAGRAYALTEVNLDAATIANDRVLAYFAGYLSAAGIAGAKLVTQTFE